MKEHSTVSITNSKNSSGSIKLYPGRIGKHFKTYKGMVTHMKSKKVIATILTLSLLIPASGCNKKEDIIAKVTEYADAVISGETDDIAELLDDDDDFEDIVQGYVMSYRTDLERNEIFDVILDNMSYSIDSKSVKIDGNEASADITYTLLDYEVIYEDLDEGAEYAEYIDALENNTDKTIEIEQTIELTKDDEEWKIVDDDFENTLEAYEFYENITGFGWLVAEGPVAEFESALRNSIDFNADWYSITVYPGYTGAEYYDNLASFICWQFEDPDAAEEQFNAIYEGYNTAIFEDSWSGYSTGYSTSGSGEIVFDATNECYDFYTGDIYGGIYYNNDTIIFIFTESDDPDERSMVDAMIGEMGFTAP